MSPQTQIPKIALYIVRPPKWNIKALKDVLSSPNQTTCPTPLPKPTWLHDFNYVKQTHRPQVYLIVLFNLIAIYFKRKYKQYPSFQNLINVR